MSDAHRDEIAKLESLYQENPEGRIFAHLADAYRKDGEFDRAHQVLSDGLDRHPDYSSAHVVRGRVLMDQGRDGEAEDAFRQVLDLDPHNLIAIRCLGDLARSRGDDDQALEYFQRLLEQEPGEEEVREIVDAMTGVSTETAEPTEPAETAEPTEPTERPEPAPDFGQEVVAGGGEEFGPGEDFGAGEDVGPGDLAAEDDFGGGPDDWTVAASGAGPEERPAGQDERDEPGFSLGEEIEEDRLGAPSEEPEDTDAGLRTETIAQVYARQGLYDRAAEVYRELSLSRPDDEGLRERLAEMEELASAQTAGAGEIDAVSDFDADEAGPLPGLESEQGVEPEEAEPEAMELEGFQGGELDTTAVEADALAGLEAEESDPETGLRGDATPDTAEPDEDLSDTLDVKDVPEPPEETPWSDEPAEETAWSDEPPVKDSEPDWLTDALAGQEEPTGEEGDRELEAARPESDAEMEGVESVWSGEEWREDAEAETPHAWTDEEDEEDSSPPIRDYLGSLLTWPDTGAAAPAAGEGGEPEGRAPEPEEPREPAGQQESAGQREPAEPREPAGPREPAQPRESPDDDDDLDMFRSWLESLKQ